MAVFLLSYARENDKYRDHEKVIGIYSSEANANAARQRLLHQPGFRDWPEGFEVVEYSVDKEQNWSEGFISWDESVPPSESHD